MAINTMKTLLLIALVACRLPHVEPARRDDSSQRATIVAIHTSCSEQDPLATTDPTTGQPLASLTEWRPATDATGVIISERHVLTAAHAVMCPVIPSVVVQFASGARQASVERDDDMFPRGTPTDIARLELSAANGFGLHVAPPIIRDARGGETCCAETLHGSLCGRIDPYDTTRLNAAGARDLDSGAPVYCSGVLVGLEVRSPDENPDHMHFVPLTSYWMEGT